VRETLRDPREPNTALSFGFLTGCEKHLFNRRQWPQETLHHSGLDDDVFAGDLRADSWERLTIVIADIIQTVGVQRRSP